MDSNIYFNIYKINGKTFKDPMEIMEVTMSVWVDPKTHIPINYDALKALEVDSSSINNPYYFKDPNDKSTNIYEMIVDEEHLSYVSQLTDHNQEPLIGNLYREEVK